ncbi:MAG TPA: phosphate ABC transporter permease PstA [Bacillota bacterium]|jgi:phosphate transport system permease protein
MNRPVVANRTAVAILWGSAAVTLGILVFIIGFILVRGLPVLSWPFISESPREMGRTGGILPTIVGTAALTILAVAVATPLGVGTAIYLTEYTRPGPATKIVRFGAESLAGIPSIIFGLFGFIFFVIYLGLGWSILSGALTLAAMILPTIIRTSEEAIKAVPDSYREISYALGGTKWQTVTRSVLPSALPGILTGVMLGMGRSIGETAAVIFTAGSSLRLPTSLFDPVRTMSVHFYILAREGISMPNAYGTAAILVLSILAINFVAYWLLQRFIARHS